MITKTIKRIAPNLFAFIKIVVSLAWDKESYLHTTGYHRTAGSGQACDQDGNPIPWMNYPMIRFLESRLHTDLVLFEWGSGASTTFFARKVKNVFSCEYDQQWYDLVQNTIPSNAHIYFQAKDTDGKYCRVITKPEMLFDIVVIDGHDRVHCVEQAVNYLNSAGVILLDDTQRPTYKDAFTFLAENGFKQLTLEGLKPLGNKACKTTIFYREQNCLNI